MSADTAALLACPFCGSTDAVRLDDGDSWDFLPDGEPLTWAVVCDYNRGGCGGSGGFRDSQKDAIAAWNQAADRLAELEAENGRLKPAEQHDPLAVSDHCGECGEPEPECACDERESLPLMARRRWMPKAVRYCFRNRDCGWFFSLNTPTDGEWEFVFRIADTDEHGLPVIERTADMPKRGKYRISWITQAGDVDYTDILPLALEANRSGAVSERIEDYRPAAQESGDA